MAAPAPPATQFSKLFCLNVKQVLSGDQIVITFKRQNSTRDEEKTLILSNIAAPKLGKLERPGVPATQDEPYAWEAREFLRKKVIGRSVSFKTDLANKPPGENREYAMVYIDNENLAESLVRDGLAKVKDGRPSEEKTKLLELQEKAKLEKKNIWDEASLNQHVRDLKGMPSGELSKFVDQMGRKPIKAIVEHVFDGSKFRVVLLPDFYHITLMVTGIRCPSINEPLGEEAKRFVEFRILQEDIEVILETVANNGLYGTIIHPNGNIAELLLKEGYASCIDWSMGALKSGAEALRAAEKLAKEKRIGRWKDHQSSQPTLTGKEKEFTATVVEVVNGDALMVKSGNEAPRKIFLSSIRPPRAKTEGGDENKDSSAPPAPKSKNSRPLYDIPWLFEAREFLRKKLIGKKVNVTVDYKQPASDKYPEKICCTVKIAGVNVGEALVLKGLATVVRHGNNDDARSSCYDALKSAEDKATKSGKGIYSKDSKQLRVTDVSSDASRARTFLSSLQRSGRVEGIVEFVTSGSRLRLYIPKENCLATFLLAGIDCPRGSRLIGGKPTVPEPFSDEALQFTKDKVMQREVEITVDSIDKVGGFIGWLWIDGNNLSVALVEEGLAKVHFTAEKSPYYRALKLAEDAAKARKDKIWKDYVEEEKVEDTNEEDSAPDRKVDYQSVVVTEVSSELKFYVQSVDQGPKLEALMTQIRQEFQNNPPLPGAYTPRKGDLCAAKFCDDQWYRARVERVQGQQVHIFYIDYGNREVTSATRCAPLPSGFGTDKPYANDFQLAFAKLPRDPEDQEVALKAFREDVADQVLLLNVEYKIEKTPYATICTENDKTDIGKGLIRDGFLLVDVRRDKRLQKMVGEYKTAEEESKKSRNGIWRYGDVTEDSTPEFGR